ncbi:MAG: TIM barrel protein [Deltaproteobacteria bacterium]|nr:TIM barrel protein [Deltaproteobacteria bacterium]
MRASRPREALRRAEDDGVHLLVEPEPGLLIENVAQFEELAARMDSPMFGLNFDVGHFYCVGEPLPEAVDAALCEIMFAEAARAGLGALPES